jgi:hypothetical protein
MGDVSFTTVNDVPSTMIGPRVVDFTRPFSMKTRGELFSTVTVHITRSFNLRQPFHAKSSNFFESWMRKGRDDFEISGALRIETSELIHGHIFRLSYLR